MPKINKHSAKNKEIKIRRQKIRQLYIRRFSLEEIANHLNISTRTVSRDLDITKQQNYQALKQDLNLQNSIHNVVISYFATLDEITRQLWLNYHKTNLDQKVKIHTLKSIKDTWKDRIEVLQTLGFLPTQPVQIQSNRHNSEEKLNNPKIDNLNQAFTEFIKHQWQYPKPSRKTHAH